MSLAGMVVCAVGFVAYCAYQVIVPTVILVLYGTLPSIQLAEKRKEKAVEAKNERALYLTSLYVRMNMPITVSVRQKTKTTNKRASFKFTIFWPYESLH